MKTLLASLAALCLVASAAHAQALPDLTRNEADSISLAEARRVVAAYADPVFAKSFSAGSAALDPALLEECCGAVGLASTPLVSSLAAHYVGFFRSSQAMPAVLGLCGLYLPGLEGSFVSRGVPGCLAALAVPMSMMNRDAASWTGARGIFQMSYPVATTYGLSVSDQKDERADFARSASAVASYLGEAREHFGSWYMAIASYASGAAVLDRALSDMRASGATSPSFDEIYGLLPAESRDAVPAYVAALYVLRHYDSLGVRPRPVSPVEEVVPEAPQQVEKPASTVRNTPVSNYAVYKVRKGDTLSTIARKHHTTVSRIKSLNKLHGDFLREGQKLKVPR